MIWLWTPAFVPNTLGEVFIPDFEELVDEVDWEVKREFITLHNPAYITNYTRPGKVIIKRSMNDTVYTYVKYDRRNTAHLQIKLTFDHLTSDRMEALKHFLLSSEGQYIGYADPDGNCFACELLNPETAITRDHPGQTWGDDGETIVSEWGNAELELLLIKEGT